MRSTISMRCELLIRDGLVVDPSQGVHEVRDVAVAGGRIVSVPDEGPLAADRVFDAEGLLVTAGLIDLHVHVYPECWIGLEPDPLCPAGGVTTMLDAGSAGSHTFAPFRKKVIDQAQTQVLALVNLSCIGLMAPEFGELLDRRYADKQGVIDTINAHQDVALGVKIRAGSHIIGDGKAGEANFREAVEAARQTNTWLMVHIGESPMSMPDMLAQMSAGDCITHCFKGGSTRILDELDRVFDEVLAARERGVVFDVGHGFGSCQWQVVDKALEQGFTPTTISTDLHAKNIHGPVFDMPTTMSKFLMLGVPLDEVVAMATARPAAVIGKQDQLGTLREGTVADIAIFQRAEGQFQFTDSYQQTRTGREMLIAAATIRRGHLLVGGGGWRAQRVHAEPERKG